MKLPHAEVQAPHNIVDLQNVNEERIIEKHFQYLIHVKKSDKHVVRKVTVNIIH